MKMNKTLLLAGLAAVLSAPAHAEFPIARVGVTLSPVVDLDGDAEGDGDGFGFRAEVAGPTLFGYLELQKFDIDLDNNGGSHDADERRLGVGLRAGEGPARVSARFEHYDIDDEDGIGVHIGGEYDLPETAVTLFASYGFVSLDDLDGNEFGFGGRVKVADNAEASLSWRRLDLDDSGVDVELSDIRLGLNLLF